MHTLFSYVFVSILHQSIKIYPISTVIPIAADADMVLTIFMPTARMAHEFGQFIEHFSRWYWVR